MPWTRGETGELVGFSGPKMTAEDYERSADATIQNWTKGYIGGDAQDVFAWADIDRQQARRLRAAQTTGSEPK